MKPKSVVCALALIGSSACGGRTDASLENFRKGMTAYLEQRGDFCLGKPTWPIDVTRGEFAAHARNAVQLPVLEKLGLVSSSEAIAQFETEDGVTTRDVRRYDLTDSGRRYYLKRALPDSASDGKKAERGDFCAGKLSLDEIISWEKVEHDRASSHTNVTYTYVIDAPAWTKNPEISAVFPVLAGIVHGAGSIQLKEGFTLTGNGWVADDLLAAGSSPTEPVVGLLVRGP